MSMRLILATAFAVGAMHAATGAAKAQSADDPLFTANDVESAGGGKRGPRGPRGPEGPQGPVGPAGPAGPAGPQGVAGPQGPQGARGLTGAAGPAGVKGDAGPQGARGLTGAAGAAGPQGARGLTGATGAAGPQGARGLTGATGPQGARGLPGADAPPMVRGERGITGYVAAEFTQYLFGTPAFTAAKDATCLVTSSLQLDTRAPAGTLGPFVRNAIDRNGSRDADQMYGLYAVSIGPGRTPPVTRASLFQISAGDVVQFGLYIGFSDKTTFVNNYITASIAYQCS